MNEYLLYNKMDKSYLMKCGKQFTFHKDNALVLGIENVQRLIESFVAQGIQLVPISALTAPLCSLNHNQNGTLMMD